ncbi:MAG: hypothetical protein JWO03_1492, partial [Bacteroidetes bacterium]|nr:hypothetical protein [Bacteroidota bacterium]
MHASDYDAFAADCCLELQKLQDGFKEQYNLSCYEEWYYDQTTGLLTFSTSSGELN